MSRPAPVAQAPDVFSVRDGEILCAAGGVVPLVRRESELLQILAPQITHFMSWQEIARKLFANDSKGPEHEAGVIRCYASRLRQKIDGKCSFGIEGKQHYGYRLFGQLLIDE